MRLKLCIGIVFNFPWDGPFVPTLQYRLAHARYIKTLTYLRDFRDKIAIFYNFIVSQIPEETWAQRKSNL